MARKSKAKIQEAIKSKAINIVDTERQQWENAVCYVTESVGFRMRNLIRTLRKNFWGVFDEPIDPVTGKEKSWIHLTMMIVEDILKNIDLDQKDIGYRARRPSGYSITELTRAVMKEYLNRMYFGEVLDQDERQVLIDGTVVWKTWESNNGKEVVMNRKTVDLLHIYIDPTEESIQSAYRFTERGLLFPDQVRGMSGWWETDDVEGVEGLDKNDSEQGTTSGTKSTAKLVDVWETWGKIPKWIVPSQDCYGNENHPEANHEIDGHIIVSGLEGGKVKVHLIEENKRKDKFGNALKPYEEWRPAKIAGRWYGLGPAERILALQELQNETFNVRRTRARVAQLGLFKIRKGAGITPQALAKLPVNGAVALNNLDDLEQMQMADVPVSAYKEEEVLRDWATKIASAHPVSTGETLPASATATSVAVSNTNSQSSYTMFKESMGSFMERWLDRHATPIVAKTIKIDDLVRITSDDDTYKEIAERVAFFKVMEKLDNFSEIGYVPTQEELDSMVESAVEKYRKQPQVFIQCVQELVADAVDAKVQITNEDIDTSVAVQNLIQMAGLQITPQNEPIIRAAFDLMGLDQPKLITQPSLQKGNESMLPMGEMPSLQNITEEAYAG